MKKLLIASLVILCGCSSGTPDSMSEAAARYGADDAREYIRKHDNQLEAQDYLLKVKSIETRLRQNSHPGAADVYVNTFIETLRKEAPELALELEDHE